MGFARAQPIRPTDYRLPASRSDDLQYVKAMTIRRLIRIKAIAFPFPSSHSSHFLSIWTCIEQHSFFSRRPKHCRSKHVQRLAVLRPPWHQLQKAEASKAACRWVSRIASAQGDKRVITKKAIATPSDSFLSRWTRIERHSSLRKL